MAFGRFETPRRVLDMPDTVAALPFLEEMRHFARGEADVRLGRAGDAREGVTAFLEKRQPAYPDKVSSDLPDIWPFWVDPEFK